MGEGLSARPQGPSRSGPRRAGRTSGPRRACGRPDVRGRLRLGLGPAGTCGDLRAEGTGRRPKARPAAGLGDLSRRRPLALDPASAGRAGNCPPPTLTGLGARICAGRAVAAGMSSCDDRGPTLPAPRALSGLRCTPGGAVRACPLCIGRNARLSRLRPQEPGR